MELSYILPLRRDTAEPADGELAEYARRLADTVDLVVVDGSHRDVFIEHEANLACGLTHVPPADDLQCLNGKARGVLTGLRHARYERVVIADDDVRYTPEELDRVDRLLDDADLVCPQNWFSPLPWHALWDTGRILLNRAVGHDWPGTLAVRSSLLASTGGYDGDVLFENRELFCTVAAAGGRVIVPADLFVQRRPPTARHFLTQRPRQAYDDIAQPVRFALLLAVAPLAIALVGRRRHLRLSTGAAMVALIAEAGRRRGGGSRVFPWYASLAAPAWLAERAVLCWWALLMWITRRGVTYGGRRIVRAGSSPRALRRRLAARQG